MIESMRQMEIFDIYLRMTGDSVFKLIELDYKKKNKKTYVLVKYPHKLCVFFIFYKAAIFFSWVSLKVKVEFLLNAKCEMT